MAEQPNPGAGTELQDQQREQVKEPEMYKVILLNDDYTTMEFVVYVIRKVFHKSAAEATKIMMDVHKKGKGVVGVFPYDIARTKSSQVKKLAKEQQYPLECVIEKE
jgi:ATP-dependent Clp protease adaptor protein ClpS